MKKTNYRWIVVVLLCVVALSTCNIAEAEEQNETNLRLVTLSTSFHYANQDKYNQTHKGFGFEYKILDTYWISALQYENSFNDTSNLYTIAHEKSSEGGMGIVAGIATGYRSMNLMPYAGVSYRWKFLRLVFTPVVAYTQLILPLN